MESSCYEKRGVRGVGGVRKIKISQKSKRSQRNKGINQKTTGRGGNKKGWTRKQKAVEKETEEGRREISNDKKREIVL